MKFGGRLRSTAEAERRKDEIDLADFIAAALPFGCVLVAPRWNGIEYELARVGEKRN